jgi:poly-beta-1,6-N-acetyl-D-glucosamine synthase
MSRMTSVRQYVVISPVKDESQHVEKTIASVIAQSVKPCKWVLVDDGSTDETPEILRRYAQRYDWIQILTLDNKSSRQPGTPVIHAFSRGFERVQPESAEFVVKLDCDVELPGNYFDSLLQRFIEDPALGIASGVYLEKTQAGWQPIAMPDYHAAGACKMMRMECFRQIGGFVQAQGWDTVDEIKAQALGWKTQQKEGSGIGALATSRMHGRVYYTTGGGTLFFLLKVLHRMTADKPFLLNGLALLWGYVKAMLSRESKLVTKQEARSYGRRLNRRIWDSLAALWRAPQQRRSWSGE